METSIHTYVRVILPTVTDKYKVYKGSNATSYFLFSQRCERTKTSWLSEFPLRSHSESRMSQALPSSLDYFQHCSGGHLHFIQMHGYI